MTCPFYWVNTAKLTVIFFRLFDLTVTNTKYIKKSVTKSLRKSIRIWNSGADRLSLTGNRGKSLQKKPWAFILDYTCNFESRTYKIERILWVKFIFAFLHVSMEIWSLTMKCEYQFYNHLCPSVPLFGKCL